MDPLTSRFSWTVHTELFRQASQPVENKLKYFTTNMQLNICNECGNRSINGIHMKLNSPPNF